MLLKLRQPLGGGLYEQKPLLRVIQLVLPPVKGTDRPDNLNARGQTRACNAAS